MVNQSYLKNTNDDIYIYNQTSQINNKKTDK